MTTLLLLILGLFAAALLIGITLAARHRKISALTLLCNLGDGIFENGEITQTSDVALNLRYLLVKIGSANGKVTLAGAGDIAIGVASDSNLVRGNTDLTYGVNVGLLGSAGRTRKVQLNSTVARNDLLVPDANGYAKTLPTASGTYWVIGRASLIGGAAGDILPFDPCAAYKVVVP